MKGDFKVPRSSSESPFAAVAALRALPARADETLGIEQRDGHTVRGYRVTTGDASTTVWIDVDTRELVRAEQVYASAPGMNYVMKDICFDVDLDDGLFQLIPPDGYRLIVLDAGTGGSEAQFVEYLRVWATELAKDNTFPPVVLGPQMSKVMMDMAMQGKFHQEKLERLDAQEMYQALIWVAQLPKESNWRYLGDGVPYGDGQTPIFWYQPSGQADYRVVYADLSVREVLPEDLPN
jgi:hypothetical protein